MPPCVAIVVEPSSGFTRKVLLGVGEFILGRGPWRVTYIEIDRSGPLPAWLSSWKGDGMIVRGENPRIPQALSNFGGPIIDATPSHLLPNAPWVKTDDSEVARLAFEHFLERGFVNYAFCGVANLYWSTRRSAAFSELVRSAGFPCPTLDLPSDRSGADPSIETLGNWLQKLPKPVAIFAGSDFCAMHVLEACRRHNLPVPEEIAVLGAGCDDAINALSAIPPSSIILNPRRVGWEAAALLSQFMQQPGTVPSEVGVTPLGITTRQSTDILAITDPKIARVLRFIREHACEGISVSDVLNACPMARRILEMRFKKLLGRSPRQEIERIQLNRVRELLTGTDLSLSEIAERTGFESHNLSVAFKQKIGISPGEFRKQHGIGK